MIEALMQRDVVLLLAGLLLGGPANALTAWVGRTFLRWWRRTTTEGGNVATSGEEPEGSWLANVVGFVIIAVPLLAVAPLVFVLVAGTVYFLWRLAWLLLTAMWKTATETSPEVADEEGS